MSLVHDHVSNASFYDEGVTPLPTQLALVHSEVSKALKADRDNMGDKEVLSELADIVLRVFAIAKSRN